MIVLLSFHSIDHSKKVNQWESDIAESQGTACFTMFFTLLFTFFLELSKKQEESDEEIVITVDSPRKQQVKVFIFNKYCIYIYGMKTGWLRYHKAMYFFLA